MSEQTVDEFLAHHGIRGMKWGVHNRSTTEEEKGSSGRHEAKLSSSAVISGKKAALSTIDKLGKESSSSTIIAGHQVNGRKAAKIALAVVGTVVVYRIAGNTAYQLSKKVP